MAKPLTVLKSKQMKDNKEPITVITAYDYPSAKLAEEAGVDMILVGDSLGNVVLGYDTTIPVTVDDMVYHTRAVARGAGSTFIIADMPFMSYHVSKEDTLRAASRLMKEGHATAIKMEGGTEIADEVAACVRAGIPVMGHLGLTPQSIHMLSGYRIQGKDEQSARKLMEDALALEKAGAFAVVLELVTEQVAAEISAASPFRPSALAQDAAVTDKCSYTMICCNTHLHTTRRSLLKIMRTSARPSAVLSRATSRT